METQENVRKGSHLSVEERRQIAALLKEGKTPYAIGKLLGRASNTIRNEIKRGTTKILICSGSFEKEMYFPDTGQVVYERNRLNCRKPEKIHSCQRFITYVENEVLENKRSFASVTAQALDQGLFGVDEICCLQTLYDYTDREILRIRNIDLPEKVGRRPRKEKKDRTHKRLHGDSIEKRPESINNREEFGHWEIDLVIGKKAGKDHVLLTLTERLTRKEIVRKLRGKTVKAVHACLKRLKKEIPDFDEVFKSITADNGSEFARLYELEKSLGVKIYYAHPYSSWERGQNENSNKIIRRFVRKGDPIRNYSRNQILEIEKWINTMYRKVLGWRTPQQCFEEELKKLRKEVA